MTGSKEELRRKLRREPLEPDSPAICQRILEHPWYQEAETIMAFVPKSPEPDIFSVLQDILSQGKTLILPRCGERGTMTARQVKELESLQSGAFGLLEPGPETAIFPPEEIDLMLVPGMAFDEAGRRLGHGKGYYDRFLPQTNAKTLGIVGRLLPEIPTLSHDRAMDGLIMADKVILCDRRTTHVGREKEECEKVQKGKG